MRRMKRILLCVCATMGLFSISEKADAQTLDRWVLGSAGEYFQGNGYSLSWTMGEAITETFNNYQFTLTQGFQQADKVTVTAIKEPLADLLDISVYPNPATDVLNVSIKNLEDELIIVQLHSLSGEKIISEKTNEKHIRLNVAELASSQYLLSLRKMNGSLITSYVINKSK